VAFGARPFGEKFCELGDAMVGALVPNPCNSSGTESNHHIQVVPEERRGEERRGEGRGGEGLPCRTRKGRAEVRAAAARRGRRTAAAALCIAILPRAPSDSTKASCPLADLTKAKNFDFPSLTSNCKGGGPTWQ